MSMTYPGERLKKHKSQTDTHSVASALLEQFLELRRLAHAVGTTLLDLRTYFVHLVTKVRVRRRESPQCTQDLLCAFEVVTSSEPTWRLWTPEHAEEEHDTWSELECKGNDPLGLILHVDGLICGIVDPEAKHTTTLGCDFEDTNKATANGRRRGFGNIDRHSER